MTNPRLVFTDLDGTLLDHHTYRFSAALPALNQLQQHNIPVILNSSKTLAEIQQIANDLELDSPQIAENGSLIYYPKQERIHHFGHDYKTICTILDELRTTEAYQFAGFHDWRADEIANITGLSTHAAALASQRQASEPLLWQDDEDKLEAFRHQLEANSLTLKRGGRFWHVMGQTDKVNAMQYLTDEYQQSLGEKPTVIALGDGPNDRDMLAAADIAVIVYNPDGTGFALPEREQQQIIRTTLAGPAGWNASILQILNDF
jgi:mannosyl-3-phosphoglycerate phosphatase